MVSRYIDRSNVAFLPFGRGVYGCIHVSTMFSIHKPYTTMTGEFGDDLLVYTSDKRCG
jgi:hypothetical protein